MLPPSRTYTQRYDEPPLDSPHPQGRSGSPWTHPTPGKWVRAPLDSPHSRGQSGSPLDSPHPRGQSVSPWTHPTPGGRSGPPWILPTPGGQSGPLDSPHPQGTVRAPGFTLTPRGNQGPLDSAHPRGTVRVLQDSPHLQGMVRAPGVTLTPRGQLGFPLDSPHPQGTVRATPLRSQAQTTTAASCCSRAGSQGRAGSGGAGLPAAGGTGSPVVGGGGQLASQGSMWPQARSHQPRRGPSALTQTKATWAREHSARRRPWACAFPTVPSSAHRARPPPGSSQHHPRKAPKWRSLPWTCSLRSCRPAAGSPRRNPWSSPPPGGQPPQGGRGPGSAPAGRCTACVGAPWGGPVWLTWDPHSPPSAAGCLLQGQGKACPRPRLPCPGPCGAIWAGAGLHLVPAIPCRLVPGWAGCARWARAMQTSRAALAQRTVQRRASAGQGQLAGVPRGRRSTHCSPIFVLRSACTASLYLPSPGNEKGGDVHTAFGTEPPDPGCAQWEPPDRRVSHWPP